ncbi:hypothetical protein CHLNCDRAFT_142764 [Chlorella variabilis]|uniref:Uncharacterized protein n=1 Tax=Chlorella variabilis TaxID=554065 RepID=E1Z8P5_CHLVA|nr:hypothetical protein CHLNCDRAFT_142764 [Chlorella variabilis]EFN57374.1 hypothetical protein CHLNCDRAFT_142764 [Chlorella variabilis]|eukprot:XP_005849476.1 hypothetical protein CHLNCDRAFT_142764 [Chlorella variabilis]
MASKLLRPAEHCGAEPADDLLCALCHSLFHGPVTTPCRHTYCSFCLGRLFDMRKPADGRKPAQERRRECPLCRRTLWLAEVQPDEDLDQRVQLAFPALYAQRGCEIAEERARLAPRRLEHKRVFIGNDHALVPPRAGSGNQHDWTFFVRMESLEEEREFIEQVVVHLHPTFRPSTLVLSEPGNFRVRRLGWGFFVVHAEIMLRPEWGGRTLALHWLLDFEGEGSMRGVELELEHRPAQPVGTPAAAPQAARGTATVAARQDEGGAAGGAGHGGDAAAAGIDGTPADEGEEEGGRGEGHEESDGTSDSESYGPEHGDAGGDYDLNRYVGGGWASPHSTSASEGDPAVFNDDEALESGED